MECFFFSYSLNYNNIVLKMLLFLAILTLIGAENVKFGEKCW